VTLYSSAWKVLNCEWRLHVCYCFGEESFSLFSAALFFSSAGCHFALYTAVERHGGHNFALYSKTIHYEQSGSSTYSKSTVKSLLKKGERGSRAMKMKAVL
jgi:hypothetical protein